MPELQSGRTQRLSIDGMKCTQCVDAVEQALRALSGVQGVDVDLSTGTATVVGDVEADDLVRALSRNSYQAKPVRHSQE